METKATKIMDEIRKTNKFKDMSETSSLALGYTVAMLATVTNTTLLVMVKEELGGGDVVIRFIVDETDMTVEYDGRSLNKLGSNIHNALLAHRIDDIIAAVKKESRP